MKEDIIANESEWVKYLPKSFKIANHTFKVVQYNELFSDDAFIWGCFCYADLEIGIRIKNDGKEVSEEIIRNTFYHELFHTFNYLWNTDTDEALAQSFANFMREFETTSNYGS